MSQELESARYAELGLARYDKMCQAIAQCHRVDEAMGIRSKARALEVYAAQAMNHDAERKAREIRVRAERRAGELMKVARSTGELAKKGRPKKKSADPSFLEPAKLSEIGVSKEHSKQWQKLADIPDEDFEKSLKDPSMPSTDTILNGHAQRKTPVRRMDLGAMWIWGHLQDFEREKILERRPCELYKLMTESMQEQVTLALPPILKWLEEFQRCIPSKS